MDEVGEVDEWIEGGVGFGGSRAGGTSYNVGHELFILLIGMELTGPPYLHVQVGYIESTKFNKTRYGMV